MYHQITATVSIIMGIGIPILVGSASKARICNLKFQFEVKIFFQFSGVYKDYFIKNNPEYTDLQLHKAMKKCTNGITTKIRNAKTKTIKKIKKQQRRLRRQNNK